MHGKLYICTCFLALYICRIQSKEHVRDKRILLSDPNYLQQELHDIQTKLQDYEQMKSEFNGLQTKLQDYEQVKSELNGLQTKLQDYDQMKSVLTSQSAEISILKSKMATGNKGAVYVHWGRKDCPTDNTTELVYSGLDVSADVTKSYMAGVVDEAEDAYLSGTPGYTGGSFYESPGAASNYVCLPPDPLWGPHENIRSLEPALMYGTEYEDPTLFGQHAYQEDAPCAVCRTSKHSTSVMIPARTECYDGWEKAYTGSLAAGDPGHKAASEYVCVDEHPQQLNGGSRNDNGKLLYQVRTRCGSLQCPPYENDKVLSCVVCLK